MNSEIVKEGSTIRSCKQMFISHYEQTRLRWVFRHSSGQMEREIKTNKAVFLGNLKSSEVCAMATKFWHHCSSNILYEGIWVESCLGQ